MLCFILLALGHFVAQLGARASQDLQTYLDQCLELRVDPDIDLIAALPQPESYPEIQNTRNTLKQILLQKRRHFLSFEEFNSWIFFTWTIEDFIEVIKDDNAEALEIMLRFPQANLSTKSQLIRASLDRFDYNPLNQVGILRMLLDAGVRLEKPELDYALQKGLDDVLDRLTYPGASFSSATISNYFKSSPDYSCRYTNVYGPNLTLENSLFPAIEEGSEFNVKCLMKNAEINKAFHIQLVQTGGFSAESKDEGLVRMQTMFSKYRTCPSIESLLLIMDEDEMSCVEAMKICSFLDLDDTIATKFLARYLQRPRLPVEDLVKAIRQRPINDDMVINIWRHMLNETSNMTIFKVNLLLRFLQLSSTKVSGVVLFDLVLETFEDGVKALGILLAYPQFQTACGELPPEYIQSHPKLSRSGRIQLMIHITKHVLDSTNFLSIIDLDPESFYSTSIFFARSSIIRAIVMDSEEREVVLLSPKGMELGNQVMKEMRPVPIDSVFHTERFWANCLLDNYLFVLENKNLYEGSVEIRATDSVYRELLFPHYNEFFQDHAETTKELMTFEGREEVGSFSIFEAFLNNIEISGKRFLNGIVKYAQIENKIKRLKPGQSYALDVYWRPKVLGIQGHLVLAILSRSERDPTSFNVDIINTGLFGRQIDHLPHRMIINERIESVPEDVLLDTFLPIIETMEIIPKQLKTEKPVEYIDHHGRPTESYLQNTVRAQRSGTCSIRRIWALAKWVLGLELYMEFKVHFILSFIEDLHDNFDEIVFENWESPRPSIWMRIIKLPFLERGLLQQLKRVSRESERYKRLSTLIITSVQRRHGSSQMEFLLSTES